MFNTHWNYTNELILTQRTVIYLKQSLITLNSFKMKYTGWRLLAHILRSLCLGHDEVFDKVYETCQTEDKYKNNDDRDSNMETNVDSSMDGKTCLTVCNLYWR